jgi:polyisoprenoid-binding protein YceI
MRTLFTLLFSAIASMAWAAPQIYKIDPANTDVGVIYAFTGNPVRGSFPDYKINLAIDFDALKNSSASVTLNTRTATGGFAFGTQAMRSKKILNAKAFPTITFESSSVTGGANSAKIKGNVTIRGVTRPLTLNAKLFRPKGSSPTERDNLIIKLTGTVNRFDFGATGYPDQVGPDLQININAAISKK